MFFLGKEINENDLFAKLMDTGRRIENTQEALQILEYYIQQLQEYRIGNVLHLEVDTPRARGFKLTKTAETPLSPNRSKLP